MIQSGSFLNIIDNSGAKDICCIKVSKGYRRRYAQIGDVITASIKNIRKNKKINSKVKKGEVVKALIVRTRFNMTSKFNERFKFFENSAVLINKQNKLIGTRIFGAISKQFKYTKYLRIASLSSGLIN
jgi:large subunit ribosomal protein L14